IVPTFNDPNDRIALATLAELMPEHEVVGIHSVDLVWGLGTLHCLTQQDILHGQRVTGNDGRHCRRSTSQSSPHSLPTYFLRRDYKQVSRASHYHLTPDTLPS